MYGVGEEVVQGLHQIAGGRHPACQYIVCDFVCFLFWVFRWELEWRCGFSFAKRLGGQNGVFVGIGLVAAVCVAFADF